MLYNLDLSELKESLTELGEINTTNVEDVILEKLPEALLAMEELSEVDDETINDCVMEIATSVRDTIQPDSKKLSSETILNFVKKETFQTVKSTLGIDLYAGLDNGNEEPEMTNLEEEENLSNDEFPKKEESTDILDGDFEIVSYEEEGCNEASEDLPN